MAINQTAFYAELSEVKLEKDELIKMFDNSFKRDWGGEDHQSWESYQENSDDILLSWNKETNQLEDLRIRINHFNLDMTFIDWVINFAQQRGLRFETKSENSLEPQKEAILKELEKSRII